MKALLYTKPYTFEYCEVPDPVVGDDDVLVRIKASGICGSDVHGFTGKTGRRLPPLIMGHEAAGVVEDMGKNVEGFAKSETALRQHGRACYRPWTLLETSWRVVSRLSTWCGAVWPSWQPRSAGRSSIANSASSTMSSCGAGKAPRPPQRAARGREGRAETTLLRAPCPSNPHRHSSPRAQHPRRR